MTKSCTCISSLENPVLLIENWGKLDSFQRMIIAKLAFSGNNYLMGKSDLLPTYGKRVAFGRKTNFEWSKN